jgi:hypothetical protein
MHFITKILLITVSLPQPASATNMNFFNPQYGVDYAFGPLCEQQRFLKLKNVLRSYSTAFWAPFPSKNFHARI